MSARSYALDSGCPELLYYFFPFTVPPSLFSPSVVQLIAHLYEVNAKWQRRINRNVDH